MAKKSTKKNRSRKASEKGGRRRQRASMPFHGRNYLLMVAGLVIVAIGYTIMAVDNQVDGFLSLYVSPIILFIGYGSIIYAIMWRPAEEVAAES